MNLNKVFLIGRLTADPQLRSTKSGSPVATFSIATNRVWFNKQGSKEQDVQFHNIVVWGRQAEVVNQFLKKGSLALIEGRLQTRTWQDNQNQNRKVTEVVCERIQLGPRGGTGQFQQSSTNEKIEQEEIKDEVKEELPEINLDDGDIKPENIPF